MIATYTVKVEYDPAITDPVTIEDTLLAEFNNLVGSDDADGIASIEIKKEDE